MTTVLIVGAVLVGATALVWALVAVSRSDERHKARAREAEGDEEKRRKVVEIQSRSLSPDESRARLKRLSDKRRYLTGGHPPVPTERD